MIGFHAFTGNDYISAFFRKGKGIGWNSMIKTDKFVDAFTKLGDEWHMTDELKIEIEEYVCKLYTSKKTSINETRLQIFMKKHASQNKLIDLSILPPCLASLNLHMERANYIAKIWKCATVSMVHPPNFTEHGWNQHAEIIWIDEPFPNDINELLIHDESDTEEEEFGSDDESIGSENDS